VLNKHLNPDEAVAIGAAIEAAIISGQGPDKILLLDVTSHSLAVETGGRVMGGVIKRNSHIPFKLSQTFATYFDNQQDMLIHVYQGEGKLAFKNSLLTRLALTGIPPEPWG
jgi:molecular chaperone DnaK (HSP70)